MDRIIIRPIGFIHSPYTEANGMPIQGAFDDEVEAWVDILPELSPGLKDLDGFSHVILIYHFNRSVHEELVGRPYLEDTDHGIFAIRGPHRPNHIGFTIVRITKLEGNRIYFRNVDMLDGTPVLDVKPYVRQFDSRENSVSGWLETHFQDESVPRRAFIGR